MRLPVAGIEFKVAAFAATLVVATALAVGAWTASQYGRALADKEARDLDVVVASGRSRIAAQGEAVESLVRSLADRPAFAALVERASGDVTAKAPLAAFLAEAAATQPLVTGLRVHAPDGRVLAESWRSPAVALRAPAGSAPFELVRDWHLAAATAAIRGDIVLAPASAGGSSGPVVGARTLLLGGAGLVRGASGRPVGTLEAIYDLGALLGEIRATAASRLGTPRVDVLVLDAAGRPLGDLGHATPVDAWTPAELKSLASLAVRGEPRDGLGPPVVDLGARAGRSRGLVAAHRFLAFDLDESTSRGLVLVAVAPLDVLLHEYTAARQRNLLVTAAILVLAIGIVLLYARALTRPLRRMAVAVDRFAAGMTVDELPTLRIDRRDEIGHLESVVEAMMRQVEDRTRRLESEIVEREMAERRELESRRVLAESEIRYRRLYEGIAAGVLTLSPDGRLRSANPALLRMLGHASEDELLARHFAEDVYAGPGTLDAVLARARSHGELSNVEIRLRRRNSLPLLGLATVRAVWDESGATTEFEATLTDVTDLKLAESQRRSMELRFRRLFDSNSIGVLFGNLHRKTVDDANDRLLELLGLRRSELPLPLAELLPDEHAATSREVARRLAADGRVEPFPTECLHRDGTRVPVVVSAAVVDPARGDFIGVAIDRTAEVAAAQRVEEQKAFYELLLDAVPTRIAAVDASERIRYWNRAYRDWFGVGDAAPGRTVAEAVGPERYAAIAPRIRRALRGETLRFDATIVRDGRRHSLDITYAPTRDAHGAVTGFLSFVHDLTPQRERDERGRDDGRFETRPRRTGGH